MNEDSLLTLLRRSLPVTHPSILVGSGDDCAIVQAPKTGVVLKTDAVVEGVHFFKGTSLEAVGWKALCRPISDFAAMGATPQHALITVAAPSSWKKEEWIELARGINKAARKFSITIVGGEITRSPNFLFLSVMLTGSEGPQSLLRSSARPGDLLCVTGKLGGSLKSERHLTFIPRLAEGQWLAAQKGIHAMMDLSDGLGSDLPRLASASNCSFFVDKKNLPHHPGCTIEEAITDGEDYELLFSLDPKLWKQLSLAWKKKFPKILLTCIGHLLHQEEPETLLASGFDHLLPEKKV